MTKAMIAAIDFIGRHRKTKTKVGRDISVVTANRLLKSGHIMWQNREKKTVMLTYRGELVFTGLHPNSKYRIN